MAGIFSPDEIKAISDQAGMIELLAALGVGGVTAAAITDAVIDQDPVDAVADTLQGGLYGLAGGVVGEGLARGLNKNAQIESNLSMAYGLGMGGDPLLQRVAMRIGDRSVREAAGMYPNMSPDLAVDVARARGRRSRALAALMGGSVATPIGLARILGDGRPAEAEQEA